jgi:hypothetical protein
MALNSPMHEIYLSMPMEANLLPELKGLPFWARMTHEIMLSVNPQMLCDLAQSGELETYLHQQQATLTAAARTLEKEWRKNNPMSLSANYLQRASWMNHSKLAAREILIEQLYQGQCSD